MVLSRVIFQAKFGKANDLVAAMKSSYDEATKEQLKTLQPRILTDISGPFDTVVIETTHESLAALEQFRQMIFARQEASEGQSAITELAVSGRNEYWTIES